MRLEIGVWLLESLNWDL